MNRKTIVYSEESNKDGEGFGTLICKMCNWNLELFNLKTILCLGVENRL